MSDIVKPAADKSMRASQLASSVKQGRKIHVQILDEDLLSGYLGGMDADTYLLLIPNEVNGKVSKRLIPKTNILWIELDDERTFFENPLYEEMRPIVQSFKEWINKQYFTNQRG